MKKNVIILLIVFIMVTLSGCVHLGRGVTPEDFNNESAISEWPEGSLAESQLPFPDGKRVEITYDSDDVTIDDYDMLAAIRNAVLVLFIKR